VTGAKRPQENPLSDQGGCVGHAKLHSPEGPPGRKTRINDPLQIASPLAVSRDSLRLFVAA